MTNQTITKKPATTPITTDSQAPEMPISNDVSSPFSNKPTVIFMPPIASPFQRIPLAFKLFKMTITSNHHPMGRRNLIMMCLDILRGRPFFVASFTIDNQHKR